MAKILIFLTILIIICDIVITETTIPELQIEALKSGKVRVAIPNVKGTKLFAFHAHVNIEIVRNEQGTYSEETKTPDGDFWTITLDMPVSVGDTIYYWIYLAVKPVGLVTDSSWEVKELKESFSPLSQCTPAVTVLNGKKSSCIGDIIFEDNFDGTQLNKSKWLVHHKIPTYSGPNFEFNSYLDQADTRFLGDNKLYIKPIPFTNGDDVRGTLNLTDKCTSNKPNECVYSQKSSFILPPVKSAKITSNVSFQYGKIEIRAKLPYGDWIVPIIELEDKERTDGDNSAKIWVAYSRGNKVLKGNGPEDYGSHLLLGGPVVYPSEPIRSKHLVSKRGSKSFSTGFHVYTLEWKPGRMILYMDDEVYGDIPTLQGFAEYSMNVRGMDWTEPEAPFNKEYVLSLGVAVGGIYDFPDELNSENDPKPWNNFERNYIYKFFSARDVWMKTWHGDDVALQVDYVKITAL